MMDMDRADNVVLDLSYPQSWARITSKESNRPVREQVSGVHAATPHVLHYMQLICSILPDWRRSGQGGVLR